MAVFAKANTIWLLSWGAVAAAQRNKAGLNMALKS